MTVRYQKLEIWPHLPTRDREQARFDSTYDQTLDLVEYEIDKLDGTDVIVQGFWPKAHMRNDGWARTDAKAEVPGVILSFSTKKLGNMAFHADKYTTWKDNLRGIGKTLEALRAIRRYGTVSGDEQYRGFTALDAPATNDRAAAETLARLSGGLFDVNILLSSPSRTWVGELRKKALFNVHPDHGGSPEQLRELEDAVAILKGSS